MWKREQEFKTLLEGQSGKLTQEGLDLLTRIAVQDEKECFKHVSVLLERQMRKVKLKYRTNVLHILSYVLRTSFMKFKSENKYAKRLSDRMTAIFELLKECTDDQKPTISRVLLAWKREHLFCKPLMEDIYEVLGWQPEEPVQSPVAYTLNCSFDSYARVVENIPKEPKPEGKDVQSGGQRGASLPPGGTSSRRLRTQGNTDPSSHHRNNNVSGHRCEHQPIFSCNSDRGSGHYGGGNFDGRGQEEWSARKRRRGIEEMEWHPPIAPDLYYSPFVVDPHEVTQPLKRRRGNGSKDASQASEPIGTWISNVRTVVKNLDPDLSVFKRAQAIAQTINKELKERVGDAASQPWYAVSDGPFQSETPQATRCFKSQQRISKPTCDYIPVVMIGIFGLGLVICVYFACG